MTNKEKIDELGKLVLSMNSLLVALSGNIKDLFDQSKLQNDILANLLESSRMASETLNSNAEVMTVLLDSMSAVVESETMRRVKDGNGAH